MDIHPLRFHQRIHKQTIIRFLIMKDTQYTMDSMADTLKKLYGDELRIPSLRKRLPQATNISEKSRIFILIGILITVALTAATVTYNQIVTLREAVFSNNGRVNAEMQRRNNLFANIVELYLSYTVLEKQIFSHVAEVRGHVQETQKLLDRIKAEAVLPQANPPGASLGKNLKGPVKSIDTSLSQLLAIFEQYPNLKSFEPHANLVTNIVLSENRVITERGRLNESIRMFNNKIAKFPYRYLAWVFGFERLAYFEPDADIKAPPKLKWKEFEHLRLKDAESETK